MSITELMTLGRTDCRLMFRAFLSTIFFQRALALMPSSWMFRARNWRRLEVRREFLRDNSRLLVVLEYWPFGISRAGERPIHLIEFLQDQGFRVSTVEGGEVPALDSTDFDSYVNLLAIKRGDFKRCRYDSDHRADHRALAATFHFEDGIQPHWEQGSNFKRFGKSGRDYFE